MSRYLLFAGENHYPQGGVSDYKGSYETVEEAKIEFGADWWGDHRNWGQIVDRETMYILFETQKVTTYKLEWFEGLEKGL